MELIFRQRLDRPDKAGRANVFGDLHWSGGNRWKMPTGVKVLPAHWQPTKSKRIATAADNANQLNLRLSRLLAAVQGVFTSADGAGRAEADVTQAEIEEAVRSVGAGSQRRKEATKPEVTGPAPLTPTATWAAFAERWQAENRGLLSESYLRGTNQVVSALAEFDPKLRLATLTREQLAKYTAWLYGQGLRDSTVLRHYKFFKDCLRMVNQAIPSWMGKLTVRYGRALSLRVSEVRALMDASVEGQVDAERDVFLFQMFLLLRDTDLRGLRPHHVSPRELPGYGPTLCVELYQNKTGEPVLIPLPPAAAVIWQRYGGQLPLVSQKERNIRLKKLGRISRLNREFVDVGFSGKVRTEEVIPVYKALSTHTARHTGADMLVLGGEGDQTLKEIALGHVSDSVYGYDTLERYGPQLLQAWERVLPSTVPITVSKQLPLARSSKQTLTK
ncbi:phage integrase SAM-like domain-containing protein [Hymenobacter convexus]|uniref:phage integrase SAM-like domain-containing protein n=1 Tax=Hymenobacter sp. CA1UV-4 TaxID=3063782 RepID=UPI002712DBDF|nr:phage integrase SAM-like domain-containing protein [Hymenobacter sp. CA1UV-4]MDO7850409.1 phage integrase SAM-like domain-containing protein [Hymenobacter sp. CA1UV-4]